MAEKKIKIDLIDIPEDRIRDLDEDWAKTIGQSMKEIGQQTAIRVVQDGDRYTLSAGLHRTTGAKLFKLREIIANVVVPDEGQSAETIRLGEITENLLRKDFNALERCEALSELKRIYEVMHPETKKGGDRKSQAAKDKQKNQMAIFAFCSSAAESTGLSERSVRLAVQIFEGLSNPTRERLKGTVYATKQSDLKALAALDADMQKKVLDLLMCEPPMVATVADAIHAAEGKEPEKEADKLFQRVSDILPRLPKASRTIVFLQHKKEIIALVKREGWLDA